jgi:hypothetical protein
LTASSANCIWWMSLTESRPQSSAVNHDCIEKHGWARTISPGQAEKKWSQLCALRVKRNGVDVEWILKGAKSMDIEGKITIHERTLPKRPGDGSPQSVSILSLDAFCLPNIHRQTCG